MYLKLLPNIRQTAFDEEVLVLFVERLLVWVEIFVDVRQTLRGNTLLPLTNPAIAFLKRKKTMDCENIFESILCNEKLVSSRNSEAIFFKDNGSN